MGGGKIPVKKIGKISGPAVRVRQLVRLRVQVQSAGAGAEVRVQSAERGAQPAPALQQLAVPQHSALLHSALLHSAVSTQ